MARINSSSYYATFHGHRPEFLEAVLEELRSQHESVIFLAGDSSLDNKYWFKQTAEALNGYEQVLQPAIMKQDVCYWLNCEAVRRGESLGCLNTAVEATSLNDRACCLLGQDRFIRENITEDDVLVVSVGGNDIALGPLIFTILNLAMLVCFTPQCALERGFACPPNLHIDGGCLLCGLPGCVTGVFGCPPGLGYFVDLFKNRVENYIASLVRDTKPRKIIVCMIYYPDEGGHSWADQALGCMCYDVCPGKLQCAIRKVFELATQSIDIPGTEVVALPLFEVLDCNRGTKDFIQRVEPSPVGGEKMARAIMDLILEVGDDETEAAPDQEDLM